MSEALRRYYLKEMGIEPMIFRSERFKKYNLNSVAFAVSNCVRCPLHKSRKQTVFSRGHSDAILMIITDPPNIHEEQAGFPLLGKASSLLIKMLSSIGLSEGDVYITPVLKCKPPNSHLLTGEEVKQCSHHLQEQIISIAPQLILVLGHFAAQSVLHLTESLLNMRGIQHDLYGVPVIVSHHPDDLLHYPLSKREAYDDFMMVLQHLNSSRPSTIVSNG